MQALFQPGAEGRRGFRVLFDVAGTRNPERAAHFSQPVIKRLGRPDLFLEPRRLRRAHHQFRLFSAQAQSLPTPPALTNSLYRLSLRIGITS